MLIHIPRSTCQIATYLMSKGGSLGGNPGPSSLLWIALSKSAFTSSACKIQLCVSVWKNLTTRAKTLRVKHWLTKYSVTEQSNWIKLTVFYSFSTVIFLYKSQPLYPCQFLITVWIVDWPFLNPAVTLKPSMLLHLTHSYQHDTLLRYQRLRRIYYTNNIWLALFLWWPFSVNEYSEANGL